MPPRSPLPQRHGLNAAWVRTPDHDPQVRVRWATMGDFLLDRLPAHAPVVDMLEAGEFRDQSGRPWTGAEPYRPNTFCLLYTSRCV